MEKYDPSYLAEGITPTPKNEVPGAFMNQLVRFCTGTGLFLHHWDIQWAILFSFFISPDLLIPRSLAARVWL